MSCVVYPCKVYFYSCTVAVRLELQNWTFVNLLLTLSQLGGMVYGGYLGDLALGLLVGSVLGSACWIVYSFFICVSRLVAQLCSEKDL